MVDYRDLYEDSLRRIGDKDRVIQDLSYRAGQAESELKNSIPMIEYKKTTFLLESAKSKTEEDYRVSLEKTEKLTQEVESSKFIVYVLASLVVILLAVAATLTLFIF